MIMKVNHSQNVFLSDAYALCKTKLVKGTLAPPVRYAQTFVGEDIWIVPVVSLFRTDTKCTEIKALEWQKCRLVCVLESNCPFLEYVSKYPISISIEMVNLIAFSSKHTAHKVKSSLIGSGNIIENGLLEVVLILY